jgi:hypothetical protein
MKLQLGMPGKRSPLDHTHPCEWTWGTVTSVSDWRTHMVLIFIPKGVVVLLTW